MTTPKKTFTRLVFFKCNNFPVIPHQILLGVVSFILLKFIWQPLSLKSLSEAQCLAQGFFNMYVKPPTLSYTVSYS